MKSAPLPSSSQENFIDMMRSRKKNHFAGRPHSTWFEYCWWNHLTKTLLEHNDPARLTIFRWGWMGQLYNLWVLIHPVCYVCWATLQSWQAQVRTRRPEHLKHEDIQILLIKVLLSFHDLLDDVQKTSVAAITMCTIRPGRRSWTRREMTFGQTLLNGVRSLAPWGNLAFSLDIPSRQATGVIKKVGTVG